MNTRKVSSRPPPPPPEPPPFRYAERTEAFLGAFEERDTIVSKTFWALALTLTPLLVLSYWMWPLNVGGLFVEFCVAVYAITQVPRTIGCMFLRQRLSEVNEKYPLVEYDRFFFK